MTKWNTNYTSISILLTFLFFGLEKILVPRPVSGA